MWSTPIARYTWRASTNCSGVPRKRRSSCGTGGALPEAPAWLILTDQAYAHLAEADRARAAILLRSDGSGPEGRAPYLLVRLDPPAENNPPPAQ